ncbi:MAG: hypothetical protein PHD76_06175 [Methylacidiphilales bacterium]|nr:hypothetical protein [Candidatus Methylacidiphilales bacterium]
MAWKFCGTSPDASRASANPCGVFCQKAGQNDAMTRSGLQAKPLELKILFEMELPYFEAVLQQPAYPPVHFLPSTGERTSGEFS